MTGKEEASTWRCIDELGPPLFTSWRVYRDAEGRRRFWSSRHHRKRLVNPDDPSLQRARPLSIGWLWMPRCLNWWIGAVFAVGASLFAGASLLILLPRLAADLSLSSATINAIYFAGSIPFTTAAFLQLYQAAMADPLPGAESEHQSTRPLAWRPGDIGWLSCALQFVGTLLFNVNTFDAMIPSLPWWEQDFLVWVPNLIGSILFLSSGYLAFAEVCHASWAWKPASISWWVVSINLLGCLGFMASALLSFVTPKEANQTVLMLAVGLTLQGAVCFFVGAILMMPEAAIEQDHTRETPASG